LIAVVFASGGQITEAAGIADPDITIIPQSTMVATKSVHA
jgi:hypothetical protein